MKSAVSINSLKIFKTLDHCPVGQKFKKKSGDKRHVHPVEFLTNMKVNHCATCPQHVRIEEVNALVLTKISKVKVKVFGL